MFHVGFVLSNPVEMEAIGFRDRMSAPGGSKRVSPNTSTMLFAPYSSYLACYPTEALCRFGLA